MFHANIVKIKNSEISCKISKILISFSALSFEVNQILFITFLLQLVCAKKKSSIQKSSKLKNSCVVKCQKF